MFKTPKIVLKFFDAKPHCWELGRKKLSNTDTPLPALVLDYLQRLHPSPQTAHPGRFAAISSFYQRAFPVGMEERVGQRDPTCKSLH